MSVFTFSDYRSYFQSYIRNQPKRGRGELSKIAAYLGVNTSLLSQILAGTRDFSLEHAFALSRYLGHTPLETDYFSLLIQKERAGTIELKKHLEAKIKQARSEALELSKRISHEKKLTDQERAVFYSSWLYSAVHLFTSTKRDGVSQDEISQELSLSRERTIEILRFLTRTGLCDERSGRYTMGVQSTFVERQSPHYLKHHSNWRIKAIQSIETLKEDELMYTGQFSLSKKDFESLREQITQFLKNANETVKDSDSEVISALNIDWFLIR